MTSWVEIRLPVVNIVLAAAVGQQAIPRLPLESRETHRLLDHLLSSSSALHALRRSVRQLGLPAWAAEADNLQLAAALRRKVASGRILVRARGVNRDPGGDEPTGETAAFSPIDYGSVRSLSRDRIVNGLPGLWLDDHYTRHVDAELVETSNAGFSYLFDLGTERLVAAYGLSYGKHGAARPSSRMQSHPLSAGPLYHRGHAIPHTLGGGTDINVLAQRGSINIGPFRVLEKRAVSDPGAFYFTYWYYPQGSTSQTPMAVDQGLLSSRGILEVRTHGN